MEISQKKKDSFRFLFTFRKGYWFILGGFIGFFIFVYLFLESLVNSKIFLVYYTLGVIFTLFFWTIAGGIIINKLLKRHALNQIKKYPVEDNPEVVIVLGYDGIKIIQSLTTSAYLGIEYLLKYLELKEKTFRVYITPSKEEFNKLLKDKKIKIFYLIGHGSSRGFDLNKKENIFYSDYKESEIRKEEIHLYHCGHGDGKTLIDYIVKSNNKEKCFFEGDKILLVSYILKFYDLYKRERKKS